MRKHMGMVAAAALVAVFLLVYTVAYQVDELQDVVLVKTFGKVGKPIWRDESPGLHFKAPYPVQSLVRYDARQFVFEDTHDQVQTKDDLNLLVTLFCVWRIADPVRFHESIKTVEAAEKAIRDILRTDKKDVIGRRRMDEFVNTDPQAIHTEAIEDEILRRVARQAKADYGVDVAMVGIKSLGLPEEVTEAVIENMKEDRQADINRFKTEGEALAADIEGRARSASETILEFARLIAAKIRSEGDLAAAELYKRFQANQQLAMFLRALDSLKETLPKNTVMVLDGSLNPAVRFFRKGPGLDVFPKDAPAAPSKPPATQPTE